MATKPTDLVPMPDRVTINTHHAPCPTNTLIRKYGAPGKMTPNCSGATGRWKKRMVTADVGPFRVTGHVEAVKILAQSLAQVKAKHPELYAILGTAGMLCVRHVRGASTLWSNHALGLAIDFTIAGNLDPRGDDMVQRGLLDLYSVMKDKWYWGAGFRIEDAMHFELANSVVMELDSKGLI